MSVTGLLDVVATDPVLAQAIESARARSAVAHDLIGPDGMRPFVLAALAGTGRTVLAVTATGREAEDLEAALRRAAAGRARRGVPVLGDAAARTAVAARGHRRSAAGRAAPAGPTGRR